MDCNDEIPITELNDFIFCPASIYFHHLYEGMDTMSYQSMDQINGTAARVFFRRCLIMYYGMADNQE